MSRAINGIMTRHKKYPRKKTPPTKKHYSWRKTYADGKKKAPLHTVLSSCGHRVTEHQILLDQYAEHSLSSFPPSLSLTLLYLFKFHMSDSVATILLRLCFSAGKTLPNRRRSSPFQSPGSQLLPTQKTLPSFWLLKLSSFESFSILLQQSALGLALLRKAKIRPTTICMSLMYK